jgi:hypothetical protein
MTTDLSLKRSGRRLEDHYDVIADGAVVGRIMFFSATPGRLPWMWTIAPGHEKDRTPTEAARDAAMQAFSKSWHREA